MHAYLGPCGVRKFWGVGPNIAASMRARVSMCLHMENHENGGSKRASPYMQARALKYHLEQISTTLSVPARNAAYMRAHILQISFKGYKYLIRLNTSTLGG